MADSTCFKANKYDNGKKTQEKPINLADIDNLRINLDEKIAMRPRSKPR